MENSIFQSFPSSEKPKSEVGKTSSLRSVRVKPERLKSLNTIIANNTQPTSQQTNQLPSPPPSSNTPISTPSSTPSTTPTIVTGNQSVLERQLNSPLVSQQVPPSCSSPGLPVSTVAMNASTVVTLTPPPEKDMKEIKLDPKQTTLLAQGKENIPLFGEKPIFTEKAIVAPRSPEVIDLENESDTSRDKIIIPSFKKRKLEILREGGLEVTAVDLDARPSVIQSSVTPTPPTVKSEDKLSSPYPLSVTPNSVPKLISVTVTPDIGHMLPSPQENQINHHQQPRFQSQGKQHPVHYNNNNSTTNNNNTTNSKVINLGSSNNAGLLQLYANANMVPASATQMVNSNNRFVPPNVPNGRIILPPKVTQSRSIFAHNEKTVYGNPKDILISPKYRPTTHQRIQPQPIGNSDFSGNVGVLDLTQKPIEKATFSRPSLEIVRVPVVPRPNPLNLEMRKSPTIKDKPTDCMTKRASFPGYQTVLDSRTMASNNLEITLVNPKQKINNHSSVPSSHVQIPSPPNRTSNHPSVAQRRQINGKYAGRNEPVSPYTPRKPTHPVIPNVPNLNHLNSVNSSYPRMTDNVQQQIGIDRRKTSEVGKDQQRRISDGDKPVVLQSQQQDVRQTTEIGRRHSVPSIPSGFIPTVPPSNPAFLSQLPNTPGKFLPMLDPMYYSAIYNGLFPPPIPPAAATSFLPPEFSAYYKELLASSQPRLGMAGQHQPAVPTSK